MTLTLPLCVADKFRSYLIMLSFAQFHIVLANIETAVTNAYNTFDGDSNKITDAFASFADVEKNLIELDSIALMFSILSIGTWSRGKCEDHVASLQIVSFGGRANSWD
jgi:hypothetical protein